MMNANDAKAEWKSVCRLSKRLNESKDCAVIAVAIATGVNYMSVHCLMTSKGRKPRKSTLNTITYATLKHFGFRGEKVSYRSKTVRTLEREFKNRPGTYLVWVRGHVFALKEGHILDWTKGRQHRIKRVERIRSIYDAKAAAATSD